MSASIRGHQGRFQLFQDGKELPGITVVLTSVDVNQKSNFLQSEYVGNPVPEGDQAIMGWEGNMEMEVKDASIEDFIDTLITNNLNGIGVSSYSFIVTDLYADGTVRSIAYNDCQFKYSRATKGLQTKITKKLDFQAGSRQKIL